MEALQKSGFYLPSRWGRRILLALEDLIGNAGIQALLNLAKLNQYIEEIPMATLEKNFEFADFSSLFIALEEMYGKRGGQGLAQRIGRITFRESVSSLGAFADTKEGAFKALPLNIKSKIGLSALSKIFSELSDQRTSLKETEKEFHYIVHRNPICWERNNEAKPICYFHIGFLEEAMQQISGGSEFRVDEAECQAMGALTCNFIIQKEALS
jgi:predicted hydrocarbon binding protein